MKTSTITVILILTALLAINSCKKEGESSLPTTPSEFNKQETKNGNSSSDSVLYYGHQILTRTVGDPNVFTLQIENSFFQYFTNDFVLKIFNGEGTDNRVTSAIIKIDGVQIMGPSDFSQNVQYISKPILNLTSSSSLEVELRGNPGGFIDLWIDGILLPNHVFVSPAGGQFSFFSDSLIISIPQDAISDNKVISVKNITNTLPEDFIDNLIAFEFLPDNTVFDFPISAEFYLPDIDTEDDLPSILQYNPQNGYAILTNSNFNKLSKKLIAQLDHFSYYGIVRGGSKIQRQLHTFGILDYPQYYYNYSNLSPDLLEDTIRNDVFSAFKRWETYSSLIGIGFEYSNEPNIEVRFMTSLEALEEFNGCSTCPAIINPLKYGHDEEPAGVVLYNMLSAFNDKRWIVLNDNEFLEVASSDYFSKYTSNKYYSSIEGMVIHEIGHLFDLNDEYKGDACYDYNSVMGNKIGAYYPVSIYKYDIDNFKNQYNAFIVSDDQASSMSRITSENQTFQADFDVTTPIKVKVVNPDGEGVKNVQVIFFTGNQELGYFSNILDITDENGIAQIDEWHTPVNPGNYQIKAKAWLDPSPPNIPCGIHPSEGLIELNFNIEIQPNSSSGQVMDIDGNVYQTIEIGTQEWMSENLKVTHYNNGDEIPNITENYQWSTFSSGAYCWYSNDISWKDIYGALYNYNATVDTRKLCPEGWHVPSEMEWKILRNYLGGINVAGCKLKSIRTDPEDHPRWDFPNNCATNESGFSGVPGGYRGHEDGHFYHMGYWGSYWSTIAYSNQSAYSFLLHDYSGGFIQAVYGNHKGCSVRCIQD